MKIVKDADKGQSSLLDKSKDSVCLVQSSQDMTDRQNTVTPASVLPSGKWIDAASME